MTPVLTPKDLHDIETLLAPRFSEIDRRFDGIETKLDGLVTSTDRILHKSERRDDELVVLRAQTGRIRDVLVEKGVASEDELSILGKSPPPTPPGRDL